MTACEESLLIDMYPLSIITSSEEELCLEIT